MGVFDDLGATIASDVSKAVGVVSTGIASGLSSVSNAISGVTSSLAGGLSALSGIPSITNALASIAGSLGIEPGSSLPLPNPLFRYATYNCIIGLSSIPDSYLSNPDSTYRIGLYGDIIAKSASIDPYNRVEIPQGSFEFYIDDLKLESLIGHKSGTNSNVTDISFKIIEPYSMGLFYTSLQQASDKNSHTNWNVAPFLLTLNFKGNTETGIMEDIPGTDRQIPIQITGMDMTVNELGAVYNCTGVPFNGIALSDSNKNFMSDVSVRGKTVGELLQWGDKSLEAVLNQKLRDVADTNGIEVPDRILILFPQNSASSATDQSASGESESSPGSATADPTPLPSDFMTSLNVSNKAVTDRLDILVQDPSSMNAIGQAKMGFSELRKGDSPMGGEQEVYDEQKKINVRSKNGIDPQVSEMKFRQDTDILNAINQTILASQFVVESLDPGKITPEGYKDWWHIDTQVYQSGVENKATGLKPRLLVYRVLPYHVHQSSGPLAPNTKPVGLNGPLQSQVVKEYNYIYTGKNVDVLKFELKYTNNFIDKMPADGTSGTQDAKTQADQGGAKEKTPVPQEEALNNSGNSPPTKPGTSPTAVSYSAKRSQTDRLGGGGLETEASRAARAFYDRAFEGTDMADLSLEIIGDPYYIAMSGTGNYTAQPLTENLNTDGSVNWQSGEVHISINFRTPTDIGYNGLYNFHNSHQSVGMISGLYRVTNVTSNFSKNEFKQTLTGFRLRMQELPGAGSPTAGVSADNLKINPKDTNSNEEDGTE
jgi:hypothetical protein